MSKSTLKRALTAHQSRPEPIEPSWPYGPDPKPIAREWAERQRDKLIALGWQPEWDRWSKVLRQNILSVSVAMDISGLEAGLIYLGRIERRSDLAEDQRKVLGMMVLCVSVLEFGA